MSVMTLKSSLQLSLLALHTSYCWPKFLSQGTTENESRLKLKYFFFVVYSFIHDLSKRVTTNSQIWMWTRGRWAATQLFWLRPDTTTRSVFGRPTAASAPGLSSTRIRYPHYKPETNLRLWRCCKYVCKCCKRTLDLSFWPFWAGFVYYYSISCIQSIWSSLLSRLIICLEYMKYIFLNTYFSK